MDSFNNGNIWYSKLESEVLLSDLYQKLNTFPDNEKTKVVSSWLANSYTDLANSISSQTDTQNNFVVHVKLLNTLVSNSSFEIGYELSDIFASDFLESFIRPALLSVSQNEQMIAAATYHFQLVCENVSQPLLIQKIVTFTMTYFLPTLVSRLKSLKQENSEVLIATLGLFRALLEFFCEDLWHELILQYLLPMKHLLVSERQKAIPETNFHESASKFLDIIPFSVCDAFSPEVLSEHFILYVQQELRRISKTDITISKAIPLSKSKVTGVPLIDIAQVEEVPRRERSSFDVGLAENSRNTTYPLWIFKYDGTDVLYATRKYKLSEPEEYFEDDLFQFANFEDKDSATPSTLYLGSSQSENEKDHVNSTATLLLPEGPESIRIYAQPVITSMHVRPSQTSDPRTRPVEDQGYFGPFLEALFHILNNWTWLDPDATVMISDLFSVLASSRIPLIGSILLDFSVVLQPCFPSFHGIIHSIKAKLDGSMKKYPQSFVRHVWRKVASGTSNLLPEDEEDLKLNSEGSAKLAETLRLKIIKSTPFAFVSQLANSQPSGSSGFAKLFGKNPTTDNQILNKSTEWFDTKEEELIAKNTILRCIVFGHWMLELAAIAQQTCWSQSRPNQRIEIDGQL